MSKNVCVELITSELANDIVEALLMACASLDLSKRTVLYVSRRWIELARKGGFEKYDRLLRDEPILELFGRFQAGGGMIWVSAFAVKSLDVHDLLNGVLVVDEKTLLDFLSQDTVHIHY
ncbi:MAG TPA: hypothetical protein VFN35_29855 [Ktedonobacteraceae bacterium]|nr:hypothetical protein [Ktedonobacteraceae bacterium]